MINHDHVLSISVLAGVYALSRNTLHCPWSRAVAQLYKSKGNSMPSSIVRPYALVNKPVSYQVPEVCKAYQWPTGLAGTGVIAIVELNGGWTSSDMASYFASIQQPLPGIVDISVDGTLNNPNQYTGQQHDPDIEVAMDIQIAAASYFCATGKAATIRVYWSQNIATAVARATADGCDVCSISWGEDEALWGVTNAQAMEATALAAVEAGMVVLAAAGDNDSSDGGPTPANVDAPGSCPHVICCGGTHRTALSETVWNNDPGETNGQGTGGGYSTLFSVQAFQDGAPPPPTGLGRMVPDVAAVADPNTGYTIFVHGASKPGTGGTSAVAPLYAGLIASFGHKLGFISPKLWANAPCFNDITIGSNGTYSAARGPDPCTGLGSPNGTRLAAIFGAGS